MPRYNIDVLSDGKSHRRMFAKEFSEVDFALMAIGATRPQRIERLESLAKQGEMTFDNSHGMTLWAGKI